MKTDGAVAERAARSGQGAAGRRVGFHGCVSLWTPLAFERIAARWFSIPNILFLWPVPLSPVHRIDDLALDRGET